MKLQEKPSKIYKLSSEYMLHNTHVAFLKFMLNKRFRNKQSENSLFKILMIAVLKRKFITESQ